MSARLAVFGMLFAIPLPLAAQVTAAVASNFVPTFEKLIPLLPVPMSVVSGSTGKLYTQIGAGAPFDVFFSADEETPARLVAEGLALGTSLRPYARGALVLWTAADEARSYLMAKQCRRLALANPRVAPYGRAAQHVLEHLNLWSDLQSKRVMGENIQQTWQFVYTGNVDCGFVAAAQINALGERERRGGRWDIPADMYPPIIQSAVVLRRARDSAAAQRVLDAFSVPEIVAILQRDGYQLPE